MIKTLQLFLLIIFTSCSTSKHQIILVEHINSRAEGDRFIDSLKASGKDTIIGYYSGCSGCWRGTQTPYYIYWCTENNWHLTKFTNYSRFNQITRFRPSINYLSKNIETIDSSNLIKTGVWISHCHFEIVRIVLNGKEMKYTILDYEKLDNELAPKVILIDKIRSELFNIHPSEWKGLDYKRKIRRKNRSKLIGL